MEAKDHQVAEAHPEHPHRDDAHRHGEGCVAGRAEDVGQGKAGRPDKDREEVEPDHHLQGHGLRLGREVEQGNGEPVAEEEGRDVHDPCAAVGHKEQAAGIVHGLFLLAGTKALAYDGEHCHADGVGRDVQESGGRVGDGVCRDRCRAEGAGQAGDRQLADLEHSVLDASRDADPQNALDECAVGLERSKALDPERAGGFLEQIEHRAAGNGAGDEAGKGCTHNAHPEAEDQDGVAADVHHIHHKAGHHADLAVALRPEQRGPGVVQADEGIAQRREQEIGLGVPHYVVVDGAEDAPQNGVAAEHDHRRDHDAEACHDEHDLRRRGLGVVLLPVADVLAGDHRAAGGQRAHQLDHQGVEGVHKAHAGNGGLADRGDHQRIGQTDGHAEGLLCNQRQQQRDQLLPGEQGLGCEFG